MMKISYLSKTHSFTQEQVNQFALASEGRSKIHTDPDYARQTPFGGTLVHGHLLFALLEKELAEQFPDWHKRGRLEVTFVKPLRVGEEFKIIWEQADAHRLNVSIKSQGETVVSGRGELR